MNYDVTVVRNDKFDLDDVSKFVKFYYRLALIPDEAGLLKKVIEKYGPTKVFLEYVLTNKLLLKFMVDL